MAKKQMNVFGLMNNVTGRVEDAINEPAEVVGTPPQKETDAAEDPTLDEQSTDETTEPDELKEEAPTEEIMSTKTAELTIEDAIDNDINMYAGITKPVSFALPKDIKRALDNFVDDYNDARPTNKTTQAKVVAQALRNFLAIYQ